MKKLSKLKLHDLTVMSDSEMKQVQGGYGDNSSIYCHSGEYMFTCTVFFPNATSHGGKVCATSQREAERMVEVNKDYQAGEAAFASARCTRDY